MGLMSPVPPILSIQPCLSPFTVSKASPSKQLSSSNILNWTDKFVSSTHLENAAHHDWYSYCRPKTLGFESARAVCLQRPREHICHVRSQMFLSGSCYFLRFPCCYFAITKAELSLSRYPHDLSFSPLHHLLKLPVMQCLFSPYKFWNESISFNNSSGRLPMSCSFAETFPCLAFSSIIPPLFSGLHVLIVNAVPSFVEICFCMNHNVSTSFWSMEMSINNSRSAHVKMGGWYCFHAIRA